MHALVLASGSPRRRQLLTLAGFDISAVIPPNVPEVRADGEAPLAAGESAFDASVRTGGFGEAIGEIEEGRTGAFGDIGEGLTGAFGEASGEEGTAGFGDTRDCGGESFGEGFEHLIDPDAERIENDELPSAAPTPAAAAEQDRGFGDSEATRDTAPTMMEPVDDAKGKQQAIESADSYADFLAKRD